MKRAKVKKFFLGGIIVLALLALNIYGISCIPSFVSNDEKVPAPDLPDSVGEYGQFFVYRVGDGKIKTLVEPEIIPYYVTDVGYLPSDTADKAWQAVYNIEHCGDGYEPELKSQNTPYDYIDEDQTIFYYHVNFNNKDNQFPILPIPNYDQISSMLVQSLYPYPSGFCKDWQGRDRKGRYSSDHPEAIVDNGQFYLYYTNYPSLDLESSFNCGLANGDTITKLSCTDRITGERLVEIPLPTLISGLKLSIERIPLRVRVLLESEASDVPDLSGFKNYPREVKLELYEGDPTGDPVATNRFGFDYELSQNPVIGYVCDLGQDYYLHITISPENPQVTYRIYFEATPLIPVGAIPDSDGDGLPEVVDELSRIYRAGLISARSGNPVSDWYFYPDNPDTKIQDNFPDCDGVPDSGDEGDWGIFDPSCPQSSQEEDYMKFDQPGVKDGNIQYIEVDDKRNIDDGYRLRGEKTNLWSMGYEAPSVVKVGNEYWMFLTVGPGIFLVTSNDGINWDMSNIYNNQPSLLPRKMASGVSGDPDAPVVSSGRFGYCETPASGDDIQVVKVDVIEGVTVSYGYPNTICVTFGENGMLDSYPMGDEEAGDVINSGSDGVINTWYFPSKVNLVYPLEYQFYDFSLIGLSTIDGVPGNPDLWSGGNNDNAFLLGDDEWNSEEIGLNPPEYWRRQNCNPYIIGDQFLRCALGGKSNAISARPGADGVLNTITEVLSGDDHLCLSQSGQVAICPGNNGKFDALNTEDFLKKFTEPLVINGVTIDDTLCEISPAVGLEYVRFRYSNQVGLKHTPIPASLKVVSLYLAVNGAGGSAVLSGTTASTKNYYQLNGNILTLGTDNWIDDVLGGSNPDGPKKDVLLVYYRFQGTQVGICPGGDATLDIASAPTAFFYNINQTKDRYFLGPPLENPDGTLNGDLPELGDVYVPLPGSTATVNWDPATRTFTCSVPNECAIAPGSDNALNLLWRLYDENTDFSTQPPGGNVPISSYNLVSPAHYDTYGYFDDWYCPAQDNGKTVWAICPGGNGYFQIYSLWRKIEVERYESIDELFANYEKPEGECYDLEVRDEKDEYYENEERIYVLYKYQGVLGDDRIVWNNGEYQLSTGLNGINQSCISPDDVKLIAKHKGNSYSQIILPGADGVLQSYPMKDEIIYEGEDNERPIPKITTGADGICNSFAIGDDRQEILFGTGAPDYPCVRAGADGIADTTAQGNDYQLYQPGENTGFDAFAVDTPEAVVLGDKIYLYYTGVGWKDIPRTVRPSKADLADLGECIRPGLDNKWGVPTPEKADIVGFQAGQIELQEVMALYSWLDNKPGVVLAPRIGVAVAEIDQLRNNPSAFQRQLEPALDIGGICAPRLRGILAEVILDILESALGVKAEEVPIPPFFNYLGSFSPSVLVKYNEGDDQPIFLMWVTGIYSSAPWYVQKWLPYPFINYQIGLARSIDGKHFQVATQLNNLVRLSFEDFTKDFFMALDPPGNLFGTPARHSFLNPTVFQVPNDSYGMIFKTFEKVSEVDMMYYGNYRNYRFRARAEWLGFAVRSGYTYDSPLLGLISCQVNPAYITKGNIWKYSASLLLLLPLLALFWLKFYWRKK